LGHFSYLKAGERSPEVFSSLEYGQPAESGLKSLQGDFFKELILPGGL
jgi:hypothetical protein